MAPNSQQNSLRYPFLFPKWFSEATVYAIQPRRLAGAAGMEKEEKSEDATAGDSQAGPSIALNVKFRGKKIPVSISPESTVGDLKSRLHPLTNIPPRAQKLMFFGQILEDSIKLESLDITSHPTIILIPSRSQLQADEPLTKPASSVVPNLMTTDPFVALSMGGNPSQHWRISGAVALGSRHLKDIPDEVWDCASYVRILDISNNYIQELPEKIGSLKLLNKLYLNTNDLSDEKISWDGLAQLKSLTILSFNSNRIATLPPAVGSLTSLTILYIANNKLTCLPDELGCLNQLRVLNANFNRISSVPATIGNCSSLAEIDLSNNCLSELPETFANLKSLKILHLVNNDLNSLPSHLLKWCTELELLKVDLADSHLRQCTPA
ncbi:LRR repeats and ubiquitin-like domain-containing protein At2g30105 isoform X2 [Phalaenopsis equestris]|uniref:LRR repeats and ubiquitin-like domain-containing protein At2g30105 isoform X2 n=1 Tax=Phalaenopsis equestris TaxID=78828 RepID=UPI0009E37776|nr:LRR repeats and ubiquitin-like domain-containing protein At2g30105 isoform X2 [Phalaenopsis equestris]